MMKWFRGSVEHDGRASNRKIQAYSFGLTTLVLECIYTSSSNLLEVIITNVGAICVLLGIAAISDIMALRRPPVPSEPPTKQPDNEAP